MCPFGQAHGEWPEATVRPQQQAHDQTLSDIIKNLTEFLNFGTGLRKKCCLLNEALGRGRNSPNSPSEYFVLKINKSTDIRYVLAIRCT